MVCCPGGRGLTIPVFTTDVMSFTKAVDSVDHIFLLAKLEYLSLGETAIEWFPTVVSHYSKSIGC